MKIIKTDDYEFLVDIEKTKEYYRKHSVCDCPGCRNLYIQVEEKFTELNTFLSKFGVDISKPDEIAWMDFDNQIDYTLMYTVTGKIETMGKYEIDVGLLNLVIDENYIPNGQTEPYFVITVYNVFLPWKLEEPFPASPSKKSLLSKIKDFFKKSKN